MQCRRPRFSLLKYRKFCATMQSNYITGQREPGETSAAEWGERPRETVTVMPVYPAKSDTQYAAPRHRHLRSRSCCEIASPGCLWRLGDFLLPGAMAPMLSMESMMIFQADGAGEDGRPFPPCFPGLFLLFFDPFFCSQVPGCVGETQPGGRETGGVRYGILRIATPVTSVTGSQ